MTERQSPRGQRASSTLPGLPTPQGGASKQRQTRGHRRGTGQGPGTLQALEDLGRRLDLEAVARPVAAALAAEVGSLLAQARRCRAARSWCEGYSSAQARGPRQARDWVICTGDTATGTGVHEPRVEEDSAISRHVQLVWPKVAIGGRFEEVAVRTVLPIEGDAVRPRHDACAGVARPALEETVDCLHGEERVVRTLVFV
mmetsp:Transcript_113404/g.352219  ORF Transcript_113404/g.352219 Transcript_113404/m.352219 type:complete len:200 (-) Transcript_113404:766-1365(-)